MVCGSRKVKETKTISLILFQFPSQVSGLQRGFLGLFTFTIDSLQQQRDTLSLSLSFPVNKHTYMYITFFSKSIQFNDRWVQDRKTRCLSQMLSNRRLEQTTSENLSFGTNNHLFGIIIDYWKIWVIWQNFFKNKIQFNTENTG